MNQNQSLENEKESKKQNRSWINAALILIFTLAALIRIINIKAPGHLIDREYVSGIFARDFYFMNNEQVDSWRKEIANITKNQQPILEPPLNEYLVSIIYRILGKEEISYARYLTNLFWLIGGVFMYKISQKLVGATGALFATAYYLLIPMSVIISRSFQPDAMMMALFLICLYLIIFYFEKPSTNRLLLTAVFSGITILLRPLVFFGLMFAFLALTIHTNKKFIQIFNKPLFTYIFISVLFPAIYYGYAIIIAGYMRWKIETSFLPHLLTQWKFWQGWFEVGSGVVGQSALILAIFGFFLLKNGNTRSLMIGLVISYLFFGIAFTYHIHTHPYYHIQLIPVIGICAAPIFIEISNALHQKAGRFWLAPFVAALLLFVYFSYREVSNSFSLSWFEPPEVASEIGNIVKHSPHVVSVATHYGLPLEYYGEFGGAPWPVSIEDPFYRQPNEKERSVQERISSLGFIPEYFVITHFNLYQRKHQDLKAYLETNYIFYAQTDRYIVYSTDQAYRKTVYQNESTFP